MESDYKVGDTVLVKSKGSCFKNKLGKVKYLVYNVVVSFDEKSNRDDTGFAFGPGELIKLPEAKLTKLFYGK